MKSKEVVKWQSGIRGTGVIKSVPDAQTAMLTAEMKASERTHQSFQKPAILIFRLRKTNRENTSFQLKTVSFLYAWPLISLLRMQTSSVRNAGIWYVKGRIFTFTSLQKELTASRSECRQTGRTDGIMLLSARPAKTRTELTTGFRFFWVFRSSNVR